MPERFNFVTESFADRSKGIYLVKDASEFCSIVLLHEYETINGPMNYFISGQAVEEDSNAAPLELKLCFENEGLTIVFVNFDQTGVINSGMRTP